MQVSLTVCGINKTTGYIRLGPYMPDIILLKQEIEYELVGGQVTDPRTYSGDQNPISDQLMFPSSDQLMFPYSKILLVVHRPEYCPICCGCKMQDMSNTECSASGEQAKRIHSHGGVGHHFPQDVLGAFSLCATGAFRFHHASWYCVGLSHNCALPDLDHCLSVAIVAKANVIPPRAWAADLASLGLCGA